MLAAMPTPRRELDEASAPSEPLELMRRWLDEARVDLDADVPMLLATATPDGAPSARLVLLRGVDRGGLLFYTSYRSRKGRELEANPRAAAVLHWPDLGRQLRVEGDVDRLTAAESDAYFARRPVGNRVSAIVSPQSEVVEGRAELEARVARWLELHRHETSHPRPEHWGGYRIEPRVVEFWQARMHRLHDRLRYRREGMAGGWQLERLAP